MKRLSLSYVARLPTWHLRFWKAITGRKWTCGQLVLSFTSSSSHNIRTSVPLAQTRPIGLSVLVNHLHSQRLAPEIGSLQKWYEIFCCFSCEKMYAGVQMPRKP